MVSASMPIVARANRASCGAAGRVTSMKGGRTAVKNRIALGLAIWTMKPSTRALRPMRISGVSGSEALRKPPRRALIPSQAT